MSLKPTLSTRQIMGFSLLSVLRCSYLALEASSYDQHLISLPRKIPWLLQYHSELRNPQLQ